MAFGLSEFKKLKEESKNNYKKSFYKTLIVGEDLSCLWTLLDLKSSLSPENLAIVIPSQLDKASLSKRLGLHTIRSKETIEFLQQRFPSLQINSSSSPSVFYKESEFKPFEGRAKPASPLLGKEPYFVNEYFDVSIESVLVSLGINLDSWDKLDETLEAYRADKELTSIKKIVPADLAQQAYWRLMTRDMTIIECENLVWGRTPKEFFKLLENRDELPEEVIQTYESIQVFPGFQVQYKSKSKIFEENKTVFLPQSMTHDWGYFIGELNEQEGEEQSFTFAGQVHDEEFNAEDMAKKIKLLNRTLKRVFENFQNIEDENIYFSESMFISEINDELFNANMKEALPHLYIVGQTAPLFKEQMGSKAQYLSRSLLSFQELRDNSISG
jgi:hypothetical protein